MAPNGLEVRGRGASWKEAPPWGSRPPSRANLPSLYVSLAGKTIIHFAQLDGLDAKHPERAPSSC